MAQHTLLIAALEAAAEHATPQYAALFTKAAKALGEPPKPPSDDLVPVIGPNNIALGYLSVDRTAMRQGGVIDVGVYSPLRSAYAGNPSWLPPTATTMPRVRLDHKLWRRDGNFPAEMDVLCVRSQEDAVKLLESGALRVPTLHVCTILRADPVGHDPLDPASHKVYSR